MQQQVIVLIKICLSVSDFCSQFLFLRDAMKLNLFFPAMNRELYFPAVAISESNERQPDVIHKFLWRI